MEFVRNFAYEASAGSGKTFALVIRYCSLLFMDVKPETILTLTFTNKAANEMSERIISLLKELDHSSKEIELDLISNYLGKSPQEILQKRKKILKRYLKANLKISTIDKFFAQILRKFSLYVGLMPDFGMDESSDESEFLKRFLMLVKAEDRYRELIEFSIYEDKRLNDIFLFLETMYEKDSELESVSIKRGDIFAIESKILSLCKELYELLAKDTKLSVRGKKSLQIDSIKELSTKGWICKDSMEYWDYKRYFKPQADEILRDIKEHLKRYYQLKEGYFKESYLALFNLFKRAKHQNILSSNLLKFNDISFYTYRLLRGSIDNEFLYFRLDSRIDHLLIDEFQDTNILQFKILEPIIDEITAGVGREEFRSFFYVGDIKQSIYRFRGGAKELFWYVAKRYNIEVDKLLTNYRSMANIVHFVNDTFRDKIKGYSNQAPKDGSEGGYVEIVESQELLEMVVDRTLYLLKSGISEDDIAILTYANSDAYEIKERLLEIDDSLNITTQANIKLIHNKEVSAVIELLKYLYFNDDLFLANFLAIIGRDIESKPDLDGLRRSTRLPKLIKEIIDRFKLYNSDENLLKLIDIAHSYSDIEAFLFESEHIGIDSPTKKSSGLRILTIHKSKGLEFKHLIISDRFKKRSSDRSSMIYHYNDIYLDDLYVKFNNRECVDNLYNSVKLKSKELEREDELNLLYVAFTRAEESLMICKKDRDSAFDILGLLPQKIGELQIAPKEIVSEVKEDFVYEPLNVGYQEEQIVKERDKKDDIKAINFGLALHYMLEIMDGFNRSDLDRSYWAMKNRYEILLKDGECEVIKDRVERLLSCKEFLELVDGKISKEQPISYNGELKQLDLLVEQQERVIIIDYKSSNQKRDEHKEQVVGYKRAISSITSKPTYAYLCYITDEVEIVLV